MGARVDDSPEGLAKEILARGASLHYTDHTWTALLQCNEDELHDWLECRRFPPEKVETIKTALVMVMLLESIVRSEFVAPWLMNPNPAFEGQRPVDLIVSGLEGRERISEMVIRIGEGIPG